MWDWKLSLFDLEYLYLIVDHILAAFLRVLVYLRLNWTNRARTSLALPHTNTFDGFQIENLAITYYGGFSACDFCFVNFNNLVLKPKKKKNANVPCYFFYLG